MHASLFTSQDTGNGDLGSPLEAVAREQATDERVAIATVAGGDTPAFARITTGEVRLSANSVTPPGNAIGQPSFVIHPGELVDVLAVFDNDGEGRHTCKVRSKAGELGFLGCRQLKVQEWIGEKGELLQIIAGQPYEYEGDWAAVEKDVAKLRAFVERHPASRFAACAELEILGLRLEVGQYEGAQGESARSAALSDLSYLESHGAFRGSGIKVEAGWPTKARERGWFGQGAQGPTQEQYLDIIFFVRDLRASVPSPISSPTDERAAARPAAGR